MVWSFQTDCRARWKPTLAQVRQAPKSLYPTRSPLEASKSLENLEGLSDQSPAGGQGKGRGMSHWGLPCFSQHVGPRHQTRRNEGLVGVEVPSSRSQGELSQKSYDMILCGYRINIVSISIKYSMQLLSACC